MGKSENVYRSRKRMLFDNFLGGIAWSLGVWIGTTVIIAIFVYVLAKINIVIVVGSFVSDVMNYVAKVNPPFHF